MEALQKQTAEENKKLAIRKKEIDNELIDVEPLVKEAKKVYFDIEFNLV